MSSIADIITKYLQGQLQETEGALEVSRKELAELFDCVPSQITYVLQTRFTPGHGYHVVSVRGGGGYIRILERRVDIDILHKIEDNISEKTAQLFIDSLFDHNHIDNDERKILRTAVSDYTFGFSGFKADKLRSRMLKSLLSIMLSK